MKLIKIHLIRCLVQGCALAVMLFGIQGTAQAEDHITGKVMNLAGMEKLRISHCCRKYNPLYSMSVTFNEGNWEARQTPDSEYPMYSGSYLETTNPNIYYMRMNEDDMENGLTSQIESLAGMGEMELDVKKYRMWLRLKKNGTKATLKGRFRLERPNHGDAHRGRRGHRRHRGHRGHKSRGVYKVRATGLVEDAILVQVELDEPTPEPEPEPPLVLL